MDDPDDLEFESQFDFESELGLGSETEGAHPSDSPTERVRIYGAEVAGSLAGGQRASEAPEDTEGGGAGGSYQDTTAGDLGSGAANALGGPALHGERQEVPAYSPGEPSGSAPLPQHWTDPPTGQVPAIVARPDDEGSDPWASAGPSWREHDHEWDDGGFDPALLGDSDTRMGALEETPVSERRPWEFGDLSSSGEPEGDEPDAASVPEGRSWERVPRWSEVRGDDESGSAETWWDEEEESSEGYWADDEEDGLSAFGAGTRAAEPVTTRVSNVLADGPSQLGEDVEDGTLVASISSSPLRASTSRAAGSPRRSHRRRPPRPEEPTGGGAGRNVPVAIFTGVGFALIAVACFALGSVATLVLSTIVVTLAAAESYAALRRAGRKPATLLGLVATVGVMVSAYEKGVSAIPLVMVLVVVTSMVWYLVGAEKGSAVEGITTTVLAFVWVGLLGSFAALMLAPSQYPHRHGVAFVFGAIVATVAEDVGALAFGGWLGRHPLAARVSPRKTWEGFVGGAVLAIAASAGITGQVHPWTPGKAIVLGIVVAVVAPLGDLCESLIKRDLGLKDMGSLLPGHGGLLDRVDGLLFVLPATYYLVRVLHLG